MASERDLEDFLTDLNLTTSQKALLLGIAITETVQQTDDPSQNSQLLNEGLSLINDGLEGARSGTEMDKRVAAGLVSRLNFQALPQTVEAARLAPNFVLTAVGGMKTALKPLIDERMRELNQGFIDGIYELTAMLLLHGDGMQLAPIQQMEKIMAATHLEPESKKATAFAWARRRAQDGLSDTELADLIKHFSNQGDSEAAISLGLACLTGMAQRNQTRLADSNPNI